MDYISKIPFFRTKLNLVSAFVKIQTHEGLKRTQFSDDAINKDQIVNKDEATNKIDPYSTVSTRVPRNIHKVNELEKKFLVWTSKKYKTIDQVPPFVSQAAMSRAKSLMRIRIANVMILLSIVGAIIMTQVGKAAHANGDSLQRRNILWHEEMNKQLALKDKKNK